MSGRTRGGERLHRGDHRDRLRTAIAVLALACASSLSHVPAAIGQDELPPGSGVDQYIESLPGAGGGKVPGSSRQGTDRPGSLPRGTQAELSRERDGKLLERVASDPALGAPGASTVQRRSGRGRLDAGGGGAAEGSVPAAVSDTFLGSGTGLPVLVGLLLITALGLGAAYRRGLRRGSQRTARGA